MKTSHSYYSLLKNIVIVIIFFAGLTKAQDASDALRLGEPGLGSSARALGMGNAYIGLSDDGSASFFNPAGFGLIKRLEFSGSLSYNNINNSTTFENNISDYSNSATKLNRLSFVFPFPTDRGSLVFGISYHTSKDLTGAMKFDGFNSGNTSMIQNLNDNLSNIPYDLYLTDTAYATPINGKLNQSGSILNSGSINNWTFSGAIEAYKNLYIGMNLNLISGTFESNNDYYEDDTHNNYSTLYTSPDDNRTLGFSTFHLNKILNWDLSGWDAKFGLLYQFNDAARFGVTVQFPKTYTVKEKFTVNGDALFSTGFNPSLNSANYSDQVEYDIVTPYELAGGFSVNLKGLILSGQATLIDYSQLKFDSPGNGLSADYIAKQNKDIKDLLRSVVNYNVGAEYTFPQLGLRVRAGYFVQPSAYQGDASNYDRKYVTGGIGFLAGESVSLDLAYVHGIWNNYGDNYGVNVSRTYQNIKNDQAMLTMTYRF